MLTITPAEALANLDMLLASISEVMNGLAGALHRFLNTISIVRVVLPIYVVSSPEKDPHVKSAQSGLCTSTGALHDIQECCKAGQSGIKEASERFAQRAEEMRIFKNGGSFPHKSLVIKYRSTGKYSNTFTTFLGCTYPLIMAWNTPKISQALEYLQVLGYFARPH
jgi:hypothetical protein